MALLLPTKQLAVLTAKQLARIPAKQQTAPPAPTPSPPPTYYWGLPANPNVDPAIWYYFDLPRASYGVAYTTTAPVTRTGVEYLEFSVHSPATVDVTIWNASTGLKVPGTATTSASHTDAFLAITRRHLDFGSPVVLAPGNYIVSVSALAYAPVAFGSDHGQFPALIEPGVTLTSAHLKAAFDSMPVPVVGSTDLFPVWWY